MYQFSQMPEHGSESAQAIERYQKAVRQFQIDERHRQLRWAPLFCTCPAWWNGGGYPPQADCIIHGQVLIGPNGEML